MGKQYRFLMHLRSSTLLAVSLLLLSGNPSFAQSEESTNNLSAPSFTQRFMNDNTREGVAAVVEGKVITFEDIRRELRPIIPQLQVQFPSRQALDQAVRELVNEIRQTLIDRILVKTEFERLGYRIPPTYVDNQLDEILLKEFEGDRQRRHEFLQKRGQTFQEYRNDLEDRIIIDVMRGRLERSQSMISPVKIQEYYDNHREDFYEEEQVKMITIMLRPKQGETVQSVLDTAREIRHLLSEGASFEELAQKYGQDPIGGTPGQERWYYRSDLRAEMAEAAFALEPGQVSEPVVLDNLVFLFKMVERKPRGIRELSQVRDEIERILANQSTMLAWKQWLESLRSKAYIRTFDF